MKSSPVPRPISRRWPLALLCAVQSCERFAFLAMLPMFVLYTHERHGVTAPQALLILAVVQALAYLGGLPGGWLADRVLGTRKATLLGAGLLACGYGLLALDRAELLWPALLTMVLGHSAFRPGLHVLLARVADADEKARERVFLWHYLAANFGYAAGALFGEWAHARAGWRLLFAGPCVQSNTSRITRPRGNSNVSFPLPQMHLKDETLLRRQMALEHCGIEFFNTGKPGIAMWLVAAWVTKVSWTGGSALAGRSPPRSASRLAAGEVLATALHAGSQLAARATAIGLGHRQITTPLGVRSCCCIAAPLLLDSTIASTAQAGLVRLASRPRVRQQRTIGCSRAVIQKSGQLRFGNRWT